MKFRLEAQNKDITEHINKRLLSLSIVDEAGTSSDSLSLSLDNSGQVFALPRTGAELKIWLDDIYKGLYVVDELEIPIEQDLIRIHARAAELTGNIKSPQDRAWDSTTLGQIVASIAATHGLEPSCSTSLAEIPIEHLDQIKESDLAFLSRLAGQFDAIFKPVAGRLLFLKKGDNQNAKGQELPIVRIDDPASSKGTLRITESAHFKSCQASYVDPNTEQIKTVVAGTGDPMFKLSSPFTTQSDAQKAANSKLRNLLRGKASLNLTRPLSPQILPEMTLSIANHKPGVDGDWIVERAEHRLDSSGSSTQVTLQIKE